MENNIDGIGKAISIAIGGLLSYFAGLNWELVIIWFALSMFDVVIGVIAANKAGEFRSRLMRNGLIDKVSEFFLLFALALIQRAAQIAGLKLPLSGMFSVAFCFKEFGSILETLSKSGHNIPEVIKKWFDVTQEQINRGEDN